MKTSKTLIPTLAFAAFFFTGTAGAQTTDDQVRHALQVQSSVYTIHPVCRVDYLDKQEQQLSGTMERADFAMATAQGEVMAGHVAVCAMQAGDALPQWADRAGRLLALSVIAATRTPGGMTTPKTVASGDRAAVLLDYAAAHGSKHAGEFLKVLRSSNYQAFN